MPRTRTRPENKVPCTVCGKVVKYKSDVARHYLQHAPNVEELKTRCPWPNCTYKTLQKSNVGTHMIRTHGRKKVYFCPVEATCTFSAMDQRLANKHKRFHGVEGIEDELPSPVIPKPEVPQLSTMPTMNKAGPSSAVDQTFDLNTGDQLVPYNGSYNVDDQNWANMLQFGAMPQIAPNPGPVSAPRYQPFSLEEYYNIDQCFAKMPHVGTVPPNAPNTQFASAIYNHGGQYASGNLASCSVPAWLQPRNNLTANNTYYPYEQQQTPSHQPLFLPGSSWEYLPQSVPPSSSSSTSSEFSSLGDCPPDYGVPLEPFALSPCVTGHDLNSPTQVVPGCPDNEPWDLVLQHYMDEMSRLSNLAPWPPQPQVSNYCEQSGF